MTPGATDALIVEDLEVKPVVEQLPRNYYRSAIDSNPSIAGQKYVEVNFKTECKGGGGSNGASVTAYSALSAALEACGLTGAEVGNNVQFTPSSSATFAAMDGPGRSSTITVYKDGHKWEVAGALGSWKVSLEAGKLSYFEFAFKGLYETPTEAAHPASSPLLHNPPIAQNSILFMQDYNPIAAKLDIDSGTTVAMRPDVSSSGGIKGFLVTEFNGTGSYDPESPNLNTSNIFDKLATGATATASATLGQVTETGNRIEFFFPSTQYTDVSYGDREGLMTNDVPLKFNSITGSDWCRITFV